MCRSKWQTNVEIMNYYDVINVNIISLVYLTLTQTLQPFFTLYSTLSCALKCSEAWNRYFLLKWSELSLWSRLIKNLSSEFRLNFKPFSTQAWSTSALVTNNRIGICLDHYHDRFQVEISHSHNTDKDVIGQQWRIGLTLLTRFNQLVNTKIKGEIRLKIFNTNICLKVYDIPVVNFVPLNWDWL